MKRVGLKLLSCGLCTHSQATTRRGASLRAAEFPALVGMIHHPDQGLILFDTGYDQAFFAATRPFPERLYRWATPVQLNAGESAAEMLASMGHTPDDVRLIVLSHFHGDHVAGLHHFPKAKIFCARSGLARLQQAGRFNRVRQGLLSMLVPESLARRATFFEDCKIVPLPEDFLPFTQGADLLGDGSLLAVDLPGHCPGHWGLALRLEDNRFAFLIADAAWSVGAIEHHVPPPALTTFLLGDTGGYRETLRALHELSHSRPQTLILPAHCPEAATRHGLMHDDAH